MGESGGVSVGSRKELLEEPTTGTAVAPKISTPYSALTTILI